MSSKICLRLESRDKLELFTKFEDFPGKFLDLSELKVGSRSIQNDIDPQPWCNGTGMACHEIISLVEWFHLDVTRSSA